MKEPNHNDRVVAAPCRCFRKGLKKVDVLPLGMECCELKELAQFVQDK